jgi:hypothetical protein
MALHRTSDLRGRVPGTTTAGRRHALLCAVAFVVAAGCGPSRRPAAPLPQPTHASREPTPAVQGPTIPDRIAQYGPAARARLLPYFAAAGVPYPPERFLLLGLKREHELQLYAAGPAQGLRFVRSFPVLGASGELGPKLLEGDRQVPEGVYRIAYLNPNSIAHLSLALDYPNPFDRAHGEEDGRDSATLGGDIMIHGGTSSVGCLAVGDQAAEDLFVLAADSDWEHAVVVISPVDFRRAALPANPAPTADWVKPLYSWLSTEVRSLPPPPARPKVNGSGR